MTEDRDHYFRLSDGTAIVRPGTDRYPWLATWLPDNEQDPAYPGFTLSEGFPTDQGMEGVLKWFTAQPWFKHPLPVNALPPQAAVLEVPTEEWTSLRKRVKMEFGWELAFSPEPDGSYSWAALDDNGNALKSGVADTWDDAKLAAIEDLFPPSSEG